MGLPFNPLATRWGARATLALLTLAAVAACDDEPTQACSQPGLGEGPCCVLSLPDGRALAGACIDGRCRHADQPGFDAPCNGRPPPDAALADVTPEDVGADAEIDAQRPSDGSATDAELTADAAPDMASRPCRAVVCAPDERCVPETGECRSVREGIPGGACTTDEDCLSGRCLSEAASGGAVPGGYCSVPCEDDRDCGGGHCIDAAEGRLCFEACDDRGACRPGWTCASPGCRVDCRHVGCPGQGRCDSETGLCGPPEAECRYPCAVGESCEQARCVRLDGTCVTAYHCPSGERCLDGLCAAAEFAACADDAACGPGQRCVPLDEGGVCLAACAVDADCPLDRACRPDLGACYYTVCGPGTDNGALLDRCGFGTAGNREGTCLPFETPGDAPGYCVEAGLAAIGDPCDAQQDGRTPAETALRCAPGGVCHDDPDDPRHPMRDWARRGTCRALCTPGEPCPDGACVDFGVADDPQTAEDESVVIGLCLAVECRVLGPPDCPGGQRCRPYALADDAGVCGPAGPVGAGGPCVSVDDCNDAALCVSRGGGTECLPLCDPMDPAACGGGRCYAEVGWGFGVCL